MITSLILAQVTEAVASVAELNIESLITDLALFLILGAVVTV